MTLGNILNIMNKDKFFKITLVIAIILLVILIYLSFIDKTKVIKNPYYAVYLKTGDMYFGTISRFPKFVLSEVWFLQGNSGELGDYNLHRFQEAIFGPVDKMEINKDNIVWISKLRDDSKIVSVIQQSQGIISSDTPSEMNLIEENELPISEE